MFFATDEPQGQKAVHEKHEIHQRIHQQNPPLAPAGGEGSGVRGPDTLETEHHGEKKIAARCSGCKARVTKKKLTGEPGTAVPGCTAEMTRTDFRALQHSHPQTPVCGSPDTSSGKNTQAAGRAWGGPFTPHPRPLSPSRGEGSGARFCCNQKHKIPPSPPQGALLSTQTGISC